MCRTGGIASGKSSALPSPKNSWGRLDRNGCVTNYGFIIDNRKCIGCHACTGACKAEHEVPLGVNPGRVDWAMNNGNREQQRMTAGLDLGDKYSYLSLLDTEKQCCIFLRDKAYEAVAPEGEMEVYGGR